MKRGLRGLVLIAGVAACSGEGSSMMRPGGPFATEVADLFRLFAGVLTAVWVLVVLALILALWSARRRKHADGAAPGPDTPDGVAHAPGARAPLLVGAAVLLTVLILAGLFAADLGAGRRMTAATRGEPDVTISLTGHQWWWEARYESAVPSQQVVTANELHIPVGAKALVKLRSGDVIHSFWVPGLNGKQDLIPGYTNSIWLQADSAGVYRGQCAEYCGHQHALMLIRVVAESPADYRRWLGAQAAAASPPATPQERRGRDVFMSSTCPMCHTVNGTEAGGRTGPDLTHVGSRQTLAAGRLQNSPAALAAWVTAPQHFKPGARMPGTSLSAADRAALVAYLYGLQ